MQNIHIKWTPTHTHTKLCLLILQLNRIYIEVKVTSIRKSQVKNIIDTFRQTFRTANASLLSDGVVVWWCDGTDPAEVVPHEVVDDGGCHPAGSERARIHLVRGPLDPARLRRRTVDERQGIHLERFKLNTLYVNS